jgi:ABC-type transporter Mla subunit MlaD
MTQKSMPQNFMMILLVAALLMACRSNTININVTFENLSGLQKNDRVLFQGNRAGYVKQVHFNSDGRYTVRIEIEKGFSNAVTEYSQFALIDDPMHDGHKGIQIQLGRGGGTPLTSGTTVGGTTPEKDLATRLQEDIEAGIGFFKARMDQINRELKRFPESREGQALKKSLQDLVSEIGRKEAQAREKIKKQWLPKIQRELDALRERLKKMGREDELAPLEREVERIRRI